MVRRVHGQPINPPDGAHAVTTMISTNGSSTSLPIRDTPAQQNESPRHSQNHPRYRQSGFGLTAITQRTDDPNPPKYPKTTIIRAGLLIPGDGEPLHDASLVIEDKVIAWVGPKSDLPDKYLKQDPKSYSVPVLMPGLWDCHVHFGGDSPGSSDPSYVAFLSEHPASAGARLSKGCWETIQRGYTSVRDVAGYGCEVSQAVEDGTIIGPNIYGAGGALTQTAGHGDIFPLPAGPVIQNFGAGQVGAGHMAGMMSMCDGVDECRKAVRLQIRRGAKVIKVLASGGVMSRDDDPTCAQFSDIELRTIVEEAERQKRIVAAHVHGKPGIMAAIKAGCKTLEHVSWADAEAMALIKEKAIVYIATRWITETALANNGAGLSPQSWRKLKQTAQVNLDAYKLAIKTDVRIALGTDSAPGSNFAQELEFAVGAGMTPLAAIKACTAAGPWTVGPQAPENGSGQLKVGYDADVIAVLEDPLQDVKVLQDKAKIEYVWKGGRLLKGPGVGPWGEE